MWILSKTDCHILQAECPKLFDGKTSHWMVGYGWNRMESAWDNGSVSKTSNQAQIPQPIRRWRTSIAGLACWCAISQPPEQSSGPGDRFRRLVPGYQHKGFHRFSRFLSFLVCLIIPSISSSAKSLEATTALRTSDFIRPLASPPTPDSQMRLRQSTTSQGRLPLTMSDHVWPCHLSLRFQQPGAISLALFSSILPAQKSTRPGVHVILFFPVVFRVSLGNNLCRFALVSSPKQLTTCANCPRSLQSSSLGWVGVSDKTATTESLQNSLDPFMHAPRSRVFRFHYHHIPISWTETAQPCQRHPFFVAAIARLLWMPFGLGRHRIVWAQLAILITNLSAPSRKPFLWAPCKAQAFLILEDKPWEYYRIHNYIYIYILYIHNYIYIIIYIYTRVYIYI